MNYRLVLLLLLCALGCGYRPPRFADRPPVGEVHDDRPISVPEPRRILRDLFVADVYVRRELVKSLDPRRSRWALDISSMDEVPRSSWYEPRDPGDPLADYERDGPPRAPFALTGEPPSSGLEDAEVITDARGLTYELVAELPGREGMRSGAMVIASRLLHAVGYRTAEVYVIRAHTGKRVAAMRWPPGIDLGPTPRADTRLDDPNDHLLHIHRRSLRALTVFTSWLAMSEIPPDMLRDVYVGKRGAGHVQHWLVGLDGALGVDDLKAAQRWAADPDREESGFFLRMFSLGLSPKPPAIEPETPFPSVGLFDENILDRHIKPSPPFEPRDHQLPGDRYWAAKRIAAIPLTALADAILAAQLGEAPQNWLFQVLNVRRARIIAKAFDGTTPLEVMNVDGPTADRPARLVLANLAVQSGFVEGHELDYRVVFCDAEGNKLMKLRQIGAPGPIVTVPLAAELGRHDYVVARITAARRGKELPRAFEAHLVPRKNSFAVIGVRH